MLVHQGSAYRRLLTPACCSHILSVATASLPSPYPPFALCSRDLRDKQELLHLLMSAFTQFITFLSPQNMCVLRRVFSSTRSQLAMNFLKLCVGLAPVGFSTRAALRVALCGQDCLRFWRGRRRAEEQWGRLELCCRTSRVQQESKHAACEVGWVCVGSGG